ncbi:GTP cyclohydrolase FolE2 [Pseudomonas cremoricolorata]|uniref:GTP cyclohydrolase FolE2 n=1 Tax=Pseudomonas cremoricolorata TaxID=157783 RepID=A0A089YAG9_9PSED|nr:GTP cyclohydrolase FolE2 [Pseudomonas cremoricolorata]AIR88818.1 GTP cyclohydrolase [Pseudomonas cremoricolorata]
MTSLSLPDIAAQTVPHATALEWVGMCGIALPVVFEQQRVSAVADAGVSLDDAQARGIHMSRLYLALKQLESAPLDCSALRRLLDSFLASHTGLSNRASVRIAFNHLLKRSALVSPLAGWKHYPVEIKAHLSGEMFHVELFMDIAYSSTCPCSAALARQLIQESFAKRFMDESAVDPKAVLSWLGTTEGVVATPHSQRSRARLQVRLGEGADALPFTALIDAAEQALGTAVQTAVKRADEQAFALANGQNLMFCEDAARRLHQALRQEEQLSGFHIRVEHAESLHAHDAVAASQWRW